MLDLASSAVVASSAANTSDHDQSFKLVHYRSHVGRDNDKVGILLGIDNDDGGNLLDSDNDIVGNILNIDKEDGGNLLDTDDDEGGILLGRGMQGTKNSFTGRGETKLQYSGGKAVDEHHSVERKG